VKRGAGSLLLLLLLLLGQSHHFTIFSDVYIGKKGPVSFGPDGGGLLADGGWGKNMNIRKGKRKKICKREEDFRSMSCGR
jgi:hypothetical protein